jgi:hypothetical protein
MPDLEFGYLNDKVYDTKETSGTHQNHSLESTGTVKISGETRTHCPGDDSLAQEEIFTTVAQPSQKAQSALELIGDGSMHELTNIDPPPQRVWPMRRLKLQIRRELIYIQIPRWIRQFDAHVTALDAASSDHSELMIMGIS